MKVILKADVKGTGKAGQLCNVSDGYARNFLLPRKLAVEATPKEMNELKNKEQSIKHKIETEFADAKAKADALEGKIVKISAKAGANGKLFGSVTTKEIADGLKKQFDIDVDKRKITIEKDIKTYGTYEIVVNLSQSITANLYVNVGE